MFKLYRLEFKKLISNPITIVGLVVLVVMMISLAFLYSPTKAYVSTEDVSSGTISEIYYDYQNSQLTDLRTKLYQSNDIIEYYDKLKTREDKLNESSELIMINFNNLSSIFNSGDKKLINENAKTLFDNFETYSDLLTNFSDIHEISYINNIAGNNEYINNIYFHKVREVYGTLSEYYNTDGDNFGTLSYRLLANMDLKGLLSKSKNIALNFIYYTLNLDYDRIMDSYTAYRDHIASVSLRYYNETVAKEKLYALIADMQEFSTLLNQLIDYNYKIVIAKENIITNATKSINSANIVLAGDVGGLQSHKDIIANFNKTKVITNINNFINNFKIISVDSQSIKNLSNYVTLAFENFETNNIAITKGYEQNNSLLLRNSIAKQNSLANSLVSLVNNYITVTCYSQYDIYNKYLDDNQIYACKSQIALDEYYIANNTYNNEIDTNFQPNYQVNSEISCYDYVVYAVKIASILIVVYLIYIITNSLSGELANGNLRITLMAPYKRSTVLFAKSLAIFTLMIIMMFISVIASSITGVLTFGESTNTIVTVFNSSSIVTLSPIVSVIIFGLCQIFAIVCLLSVVIMLSVMIKNFFVSLAVNVVTLAGIFALTKISLPIMSFLPTNNFNLNKYFYAFTYNGENIMNKILDGVSYSVQDFYISLIIALVTFVIVNIISYQVFKRKSY